MKLSEVDLQVEPNLANEKTHRTALSESGWSKMNDKNKVAVIADYINHEGENHCAYLIAGDAVYWSQVEIADPTEHKLELIKLRKFYKDKAEIIEEAQRAAAEEIEAANEND